ncbi:hypothetical protein JX265_010537 [Neoarthrinium moseri]|uniref:JmjC domain-containing protein n=1 Tax=Neoarthrinium moseri TaxID=1658444 RepID=A0A9P9WE14_9PEZI|nr:hypothetical protein JX265_010537 [Neoarthrinium moseri]
MAKQLPVSCFSWGLQRITLRHRISQLGNHDVSLNVRRAASTVPICSDGVDLDEFRRTAFIPGSPLLIRGSLPLPAVRTWFDHHEDQHIGSLSRHITDFASCIFPYELVIQQAAGQISPYSRFQGWLRGQHPELSHLLPDAPDLGREAPNRHSIFHQLHAPLLLLMKAIEYNKSQGNTECRIKQLYIAQSQLNELPQALQDDLPAPELVRQAGKGDVYDSSIWLGLEPTYTPLHRDPNPNLFLQMLSAKTVRLLPPNRGQRLYAQVQKGLGAMGNSRFRGSEMMQGPERTALYEAVWGPGASEDILEAKLQAGDLLFIPKGWWHSVLSAFDDGRLNASANWWFR